MTNLIDTEEYAEQAGLVGPHKESHEPRLNGLELLAPGITPISGYMKWDATKGTKKWGMAYNAKLSCCGFSMWQHYNAAKALANGEDWKDVQKTCWLPHYPSLPPAYYAYGISQGEPGPHPDQGVSNAAMFAWAYKLGLIDGYMEFPIPYADWFGMTFNGHAIGQDLDGPTAINDFNATPQRIWKAMGKSDGHDTLGILGDGEGGGAEVTWGGLIYYDVTYRTNNWTDTWVIVDKEDTNVDQVKLDAILTEMHGVTERPSNHFGASRKSFILTHPIQDIHDVFDKGEELLESHYKKLDRDLVELLSKSMSRAAMDLLVKELLRLAAEYGPLA